jgi:co-chaperonin GroES (HSP10)
MNDMLDSPGVRVGNELNAFIPADAPIRCLRDRIVVEPLDWRPSKIIIVAGYQGKPLRGIVLAAGPGCYPIQYQDAMTGRWSFSVPKGRRKAMRPSKAFRPCDVRVGDLVEFGGLEIGGFLHPTIMWGNKEVVLCREEDVAGVCESEAA